jgi:CRISPR-associated protein Cmr5
MPIQTKAQQDLVRAAELVSQVAKKEEEVRKIYGGLCHSFPILVRTCGLCQALAFHKDKATPPAGGSKPRDQAHKLLLDHVAALLGDVGGDPLEVVRKEGAVAYMRHTRRVLSGWIYFKRFAVSILKVENNGNEDTTR